MTNSDLTASAANTHFAAIVKKMGQPGGVTKLTINERKFAIAMLIGSVIPADKRILDVEIACLNKILQSKYHITTETLREVDELTIHGNINTDNIENYANKIPELLSIEDRCVLVGQLWDVALSDHHLDPAEERLVFKIADATGVPRKHVIQQQARASAQS